MNAGLAPNTRRSSLLLALACALLTLPALSPRALAVPPTPEQDAKMAGKWHVVAGGSDRQYEITKGRNIKIQGGNLPEKRGKLLGQEDGSYQMKLDEDRVLKINFDAAKNEMVVQVFRSEKELKDGAASMWKTNATRLTP